MNIAWFYLLLIQLGFSYSYPLSKEIVQVIDPLLWSTLRVALTAITLFVISRSMGLKEFRVKIPRWHLFILSLCGVSLNQYFFIEGLKTSSATDAAIMATTIPVWVFLGCFIFKIEVFSIRKLIGIFSAIAGVLILFGRPSAHVSPYLILNGAIYAIYVVAGFNYMKRERSILLLTHLFFYGTLGLVLLTTLQFLRGKVELPSSSLLLQPRMMGSMLQVVIFGTIVPYFFNVVCTKRLSAVIVSLGTTIQPPFTAALDFLINRTSFDPLWVISGTLVAFGMLLSSGLKFHLKKWIPFFPRPFK